MTTRSHARKPALRPSTPDEVSWLASIPSTSHEHARCVLARLRRIDSEVVVDWTPRGPAWNLPGRMLCALTLGDGVIEGHIGDYDRRVPLRSQDGIERFLDEVLGELLRERAGGREDEPLLSAEELEAFRA